MGENPIRWPDHQNPASWQQQQSLTGPKNSSMITQVQSNQSASHIHHQHQKSQLLPLLLSPRPPSLTPNSADQTEQPEPDHDQIIDQVISLENDFNETSGIMSRAVDIDTGSLIMSHQHYHQQQQQQQQLPQQQQQQLQSQPQQHQQHQNSDTNIQNSSGLGDLTDSNQFSNSSEDLLDLLLQFEPGTNNLIGMCGSQQMDQDEKIGIENIRKQLMSCEVQSDQQHNTNSMSPIMNQMPCQTQQPGTLQQHQHQQQHDNLLQQHVSTQLLSQSAPVIPLHQQQQQHQMAAPSSSRHQQHISNDQSNIIHSPYSNIPMNNVPVSTSGQSYANQQQQHVNRISQSNPMSIVNNSPSPSWQQPQLSPYSPQNQNNSRTTPQRQGQQHHAIHQTTTSPQLQQIHQLQQRSPSQSVSPPATNEPSPVVKKNPLLNAQLVNSRAPSITPTRFLSNQTSVLNQNPILNAKLSQSPFVSNSSNSSVVSSPVNPSLNPQPRFIQQNQTNYNYEISQQQNAQQHTPQNVNIYGDQQSTNQIFRSNTLGHSGGNSPMVIGDPSPSGGLGQQVKQEIRRKVTQPKQQQTTSLLKQLLSDDSK